jgi:hypothetical protein
VCPSYSVNRSPIALQVIDPKVAEHRGRIVNSPGDSVLIEFASAVDAAHCAVEIQKEMAERNSGIARTSPSGRVWSFRPLNLLAKLEFVLPNCNYRLSKPPPDCKLFAGDGIGGRCEHHRRVARVSL